MHPNDSSLPAWIESVYERLVPQVTEADDGLTMSEARELAIDAIGEEMDLKPADVEHAIQRLLDRGYLYAVDGRLFVTEPPDDDST